jgi:hydroxymethylbilane synthase
VCIETREGDSATIVRVRALHDADTALRIDAERAMNKALGGSCQVPIAALALRDGDQLFLQGLVGHAQSGRLVRAQASGSIDAPEALGLAVAQALLDAGAGEFL